MALLRVGGWVGGRSPAPLCIMGNRPGARREINEQGGDGGRGRGRRRKEGAPVLSCNNSLDKQPPGRHMQPQMSPQPLPSSNLRKRIRDTRRKQISQGGGSRLQFEL